MNHVHGAMHMDMRYRKNGSICTVNNVTWMSTYIHTHTYQEILNFNKQIKTIRTRPEVDDIMMNLAKTDAHVLSVYKINPIMTAKITLKDSTKVRSVNTFRWRCDSNTYIKWSCTIM